MTPTKQMVCIKDYSAASFPKNYEVKKDEVVEVLGYLRGENIVLKLDPVIHPSHYKHLSYESFVMFDKAELKRHFKEVP